eukprot:217282-Chlamydomonas_euryale.AAC.3
MALLRLPSRPSMAGRSTNVPACQWCTPATHVCHTACNCDGGHDAFLLRLHYTQCLGCVLHLTSLGEMGRLVGRTYGRICDIATSMPSTTLAPYHNRKCINDYTSATTLGQRVGQTSMMLTICSLNDAPLVLLLLQCGHSGCFRHRCRHPYT